MTGLQAGQLSNCGPIAVGAIYFSLLPSVLTDSEVKPASYSMARLIGCFRLGDKAVGT